MTKQRFDWLTEPPPARDFFADAPAADGKHYAVRGDPVSAQLFIRDPRGVQTTVALDGMSQCASWVWTEAAQRIEHSLNALVDDAQA